MIIVEIDEAAARLEELIGHAVAGEEVVITRDSRSVAKLVAVRGPEPRRRFGALKDELEVSDEFFDPLPCDGVTE